MIVAGVAAVAILSLGSMAAVAVLHGDHDGENHDDDVHKARVRVVTVGENGEAHEHEFGEKRAFLGVQVGGTDDDQGARIDKVVEDSAAERAGLMEGDVIVSFNGETVDDPVGLTRAIRGVEPGQTVDVEVLRDGQRRTLGAEMGERPGHRAMWFSDEDNPFVFNFDFDFDSEEMQEHMEKLHEHLEGLQLHIPNLEGHFMFRGHRPLLGVQIVETTPELREHLGGTEDAGILVGKVMEGTPAEEAGVEVGDLIVAVNGDSIGGTRDLRAALAEYAGSTMTVDVIRDGRRTALSVFVPEPENVHDSGDNTWYGDPAAIEDAVRQALEAAEINQRDAKLAMEEARRALHEAHAMTAAENAAVREEIQKAVLQAQRVAEEASAIERDELRRALEDARKVHMEAIERAHAEAEWY